MTDRPVDPIEPAELEWPRPTVDEVWARDLGDELRRDRRRRAITARPRGLELRIATCVLLGVGLLVAAYVLA